MTLDHVKNSFDPALAIGLLLASLFCLHGIHWGRVECWNPDQMALRDLVGLRPGHYRKPPFHTYLNHLLVVEPVRMSLRLGHVPPGQRNQANGAILVGSRLLVLVLCLGTILFAYAISARCYGQGAARIIALFFATSAGLIAYAHFLTADSPLLFWMMAAFFFANRIALGGKSSDYLWCGFLTGIATATKYNGLAVGFALVVAHFLASKNLRWQNLVLSWPLVFGLLVVPLGFIAGNPYGVFRDWNRFRNDFLFNYIVTPRYEGQPDHPDYIGFLKRIPEIIGLPGAVVIALCLLIAIIVVFRRWDLGDAGTRGFILASAVFLLYFAKFGAFPRQPTRFVLPAVPFLLLMIGPALGKRGLRKVLLILIAPVLIYNCVSSYFVGQRFNQDPRLTAQVWLLQNAKAGSIIESSPKSPHWSKLPELGGKEVDVTRPNWEQTVGAAVIDLRMPLLNGRSDLFRRIFPNQKWVGQYAAEHQPDSGAWAYTAEALRTRDPDLISFYSYDLASPNERLHKYYGDLFARRYPYEVAFTSGSPPVPGWVYPRDIDFLGGRITIFHRKVEGP